jgi:hypothetical protein
MLTAIISFFGGNAFRMMFGWITSWLEARQSHAFELERMKLQGEQDAAQHARNLESQRLQAELGAKIIHVQAEADLSRLDAEIFGRAVELTSKATGIWLVDLWNGIIRPLLATICMALVTLHFYRHNWVLDDQGWALCGAVLGVYVADRALFKRGK